MNRLVLGLAATALCAYNVANVAPVTFLSVTLVHVILCLRVAREIIGFLSGRNIHTYIQTISEIRCRISCLALIKVLGNNIINTEFI